MLLKKTCFILFISLCCISFSENPIVLQNGNNSYNGCEDTYLVTSVNYTQLINENFGDKEILKAWS